MPFIITAGTTLFEVSAHPCVDLVGHDIWPTPAYEVLETGCA
ncbi:hypothetical protein [Sphingomonas gei]|nr:hypothetical protein [Sphingomonas gei]